MNEFTNEAIDFAKEEMKKLAPNVFALGEKKLELIRSKFEDIEYDIKDAIALHYILDQTDMIERFGLMRCLDELVEDMQHYASMFDDDATGRVYLFELLMHQLRGEIEKEAK